MAPRETYVRCVVKVRGFEVHAGLEWRAGDDLHRLRALVRMEVREVLFPVAPAMGPMQRGLDDMEATLAIGDCLAKVWPGRAYFLELGCELEPDAWTQVYQPWGMPREDQASSTCAPSSHSSGSSEPIG